MDLDEDFTLLSSNFIFKSYHDNIKMRCAESAQVLTSKTTRIREIYRTISGSIFYCGASPYSSSVCGIRRALLFVCTLLLDCYEESSNLFFSSLPCALCKATVRQALPFYMGVLSKGGTPFMFISPFDTMNLNSNL